jgi:hypothetical protein
VPLAGGVEEHDVDVARPGCLLPPPPLAWETPCENNTLLCFLSVSCFCAHECLSVRAALDAALLPIAPERQFE